MLRSMVLGRPAPLFAATAAALGLCGALLVGGAFAAPAEQGAQRGAQVFADNCQVCHGDRAQGYVGPPLVPTPPEIISLPRAAIVQDLTGLIRNGIPGAMPRFLPQQLSDADIAALVDFFVEENQRPPLGRSYYEALAPVPTTASTEDRLYFTQTQHTVNFAFKRFWEENGGAAMFGFPITEEYVGWTEPADQPFTMQDFERARFMYHPDRAGQADEVTLAPLPLLDSIHRTHFLQMEGPGGPPPGPGGPPPGP